MRDLLGRADEVALAAEALVELFPESLEQVNVFGFLAGELKKSAHAVVIAGKLRTGMIDDVGKNELLDQTEHGEILAAADLIECQLLLRAKKREVLYLRQRLRHEWFGEIELLFAADQVFHSPADPFGCGQCRLIRVMVLHVSPRARVCCKPLTQLVCHQLKYRLIERLPRLRELD